MEQENKPALTATLQEVKNYLREHYHKGVECPACGQLTRLYRRPLTSAMAYALLLIYHHSNPNHDWMHVEKYLKTAAPDLNLRGDFHKLVLWNLLEAKKDTHKNGSPRNGFYKITDQGVGFIKGKFPLPSHVLIYNGKVQGFGTKRIFFQDVMKTKFDFVALMEEVV